MRLSRRHIIILALTVGLLVLPTVVSGGEWYGVLLDTSSNAGINATFAFDLISTNDTTNCVEVSQLKSDAKVGHFFEYGGGHDDDDVLSFGLDDRYISICDSSRALQNSFVVEIDSLGTYFGFAVEFNPTTVNKPGARDEFAFYFLGANSQSPFQTSDDRANALFSIVLNDDGSEDLTVFDPMEFIPEAGNDSLKLDLGEVIGVPLTEIRDRLRILSAHPNPFSNVLEIRYSVPVGGEHLSVGIYDIQGRLVKKLLDGEKPPGEATIRWSGTDETGSRVASGVYFIRFKTPKYTTIRKVITSP